MKQSSHSIAAIFNYAPHYRLNIYQQMGQELGIDFFVGDRLRTQIKPLDVTQLPRFKAWLRNRWCKGFYWQQGFLRHFSSYDTFLVTGEIKNLTSWVLMGLAKLTGKRVVLWTHGWYSHGGRCNEWIQRRYFAAADAVLTYSERGQRLLIEQGIRADKIACIYNSLAYEEQLVVRKQLHPTPIYTEHFGNEHPVLLFIGRLEANKRIDQLLHSLVRMNKQGRAVNLVLVGDGSEQEALRELAQRLGVAEQVWFYGPSYAEPEIGQLLYNADLCVSPGNVGLTAMHAMMYGLPVASHRDFTRQGPEVEAIIEGKTGFLFTPDSLDDLTESILSWLERYALQPVLREEVRANCYQIIDAKYNPPHQLQVLRKALF